MQVSQFIPRFGQFIARAMLVAIALQLVACDSRPPEPREIRGNTMGTTYSIKISGVHDKVDLQRLKQQVDEKLAAINKTMSTWDPESELMQLNDNPSAECVPISSELSKVIIQALEVGLVFSGFDITIGPLVNLWGFGPDTKAPEPPSEQEIATALSRTGQADLTLSDGCLLRQKPNMFIDLSSIAKGYAVDEIGALLKRKPGHAVPENRSTD